MIDELEKAAHAVEKEKWYAASMELDGRVSSLVSRSAAIFDPMETDSHVCFVTPVAKSEELAEYIAAANPETILKLLAVVKAAVEYRNLVEAQDMGLMPAEGQPTYQDRLRDFDTAFREFKS